MPGLILFRFDAPLFFANADHFERRVRAVIVSAEDSVQRVVIAAEPITDVDTSAAPILEALVQDLNGAGIELHFAELKGPVMDRVRQSGVLEHFTDEQFHPTIGSAVSAYVRAHGVEWTNWDDRR